MCRIVPTSSEWLVFFPIIVALERTFGLHEHIGDFEQRIVRYAGRVGRAE
jgi:hypothetical protein